MKSIKYYGDLKDDIKVSKNPFSCKREIFKRIRYSLIWVPICFICFLVCCRFNLDLFQNYYRVSFCYFCVIILPLIQFVQYKFNKNYDVRKFNEANNRLDEIVDDLKKENILVSKDNIQEAVIKEHQEKRIEEKNGEKKSIETIENQFYFLDRDEKLRLLKSIRKILKEGKKVVSDETSFCIEEDFIEIENSPVRVIKYLEKINYGDCRYELFEL